MEAFQGILRCNNFVVFAGLNVREFITFWVAWGENKGGDFIQTVVLTFLATHIRYVNSTKNWPSDQIGFCNSSHPVINCYESACRLSFQVLESELKQKL